MTTPHSHGGDLGWGVDVDGATDDNSRADAPAARARSRWGRFVIANKQYCRMRIQPRLYAVPHMTALDCWLRLRTRRTTGDAALLEFGCGRTFRLTRVLADRFPRRCATDIDDIDPRDVPSGVVFRRGTVDHIPFADASFDTVVIRSVLEHVDDPAQTFAELARVTRPGGSVLMNLPNKWDYVSVLARLAGRFKSSVLKTMVQTAWEDFPVRYRCNTRRALTAYATRAGFTVQHFMPLPAQPSYLTFFVPLYVAGALYQFAISLLRLDALQPCFVVMLRRNEDGASGASTPQRRRTESPRRGIATL